MPPPPLRFAANLSLLYPQLDLLSRFAAAAADGFAAVECQFPYAHPAAELAARLQAHGLQQVLINAPPGDWAAGERGLASLPARRAAFRHALLTQALPYAQALGCTRLHVMAGLVQPDLEPSAQQACYEDNLAWAAQQAAPLGITLLVEALNPRDMPGYLLQRQADAHAVVQRVGAANLRVQLDLYHAQIVEGDLTALLEPQLRSGRVDHLQLAGVPDRQEPDRGELDLDGVLTRIADLGYRGWIGCEYRPRGDTSAGLGWLRRLRAQGLAT